MSKISREDNKKRFKTGMYPTQQDFENVFDSYVHKDDTIDPSKIVSGDENIVDIINRKAEERHNHPISEVDNLSETLQQIQDDLDTAEDNIAGHETRIVTLEAAKTDYEAFKERVRAFLEDANASDTTIDRWHEIENFLQGITDTETLTGLLNDLKQEILREIPEPQTGNYLELVDDLDAYTDAPDGKIVKYVGQTNEKYTRGFDYEKVAGEKKTVQPNHKYLDVHDFAYLPDGYYTEHNVLCGSGEYSMGGNSAGQGPELAALSVGSTIYSWKHNDYVTVIDIDGNNVTYRDKNGVEGTCSYLRQKTYGYPSYISLDGSIVVQSLHQNNMLVQYNGGAWQYVRLLSGFVEDYERTADSVIELGSPSTWQPIPSFNVIN